MSSPGVPPAPSPRRQLAVILVLAAVFCGAHLAEVWHPYRWLKRDGSFYYGVAHHLSTTGSLAQNENHPRSWYERDLGWNRNLDAAWSNVALGADGRTWYPKHPLLLPLLAAPWVLAAGPWGALGFNLFFVLLLPVLAWRIAWRIAPGWAALVPAALFTAAPFYTEQAWSFSNDALGAVLVLSAILAALESRGLFAGVLLGLATWAKLTNVLLAPAVLGAFALRGEWRALGRAAVGFGVPALLLGLTHTVLFGSPVVTGYHRVLVRVNSSPTVHSVAGDFEWARFAPSLLGVTGELVVAWPLFVPALAGLAVLAWRRRWAPVLLLAWTMLVPIAFHAPYRWNRIAFVLSSLALTVPAIAALFSLGRRPRAVPEPAGRVRWARVLVAGLVVVPLLAGATRALVAPAPRTLVERIREAEVRLGEVPCDYFNNQNQRWECSHFDRGTDALMTGPTHHPAVRLEGRRVTMVLLSPHPTGRPRAITYPVPGEARALVLEHGVADGHRGAVPLRVLAAGTVLFETRVEPGGRRSVRLDLPPGTSEVTLETKGRAPAPLLVDGSFE